MKITLDIEDDYDFSLLGISCHSKDYRLSWELNRSLSIHLKRDEAIATSNKNQEEYDFPTHRYYDEVNHLNYCLIDNKFEGNVLIPELAQMDYIFKISGFGHTEKVSELKQKVQSIEIVLTTVKLDAQTLKSKPILLF